MDIVIRSNPAFKNLENDAVSTINVVASVNIKIDEEKGATDMCKAWEDQKMVGRQEMLQIYIKELAEDGKEKTDIISRLVSRYKLSSEEAEALYDETMLLTV